MSSRLPHAVRGMLAGLLLFAAAGGAAAETSPRAFMEQLGNRAIQQLADPGLDAAAREKRFRTLFREAFAVEDIVRTVLGRYARGAQPAELARFEDLFVAMQARRFAGYFQAEAKPEFVVRDGHPEGSSGTVRVASEVRRPPAAPLAVVWRLDPEAGTYRVLDVLAEGVSMAVTLNSEYGAFLQRNGGDLAKLNDVLQKKTAGPG